MKNKKRTRLYVESVGWLKQASAGMSSLRRPCDGMGSMPDEAVM